MDREALGPAERIIQTLLSWGDHLYHGRPGVVSADGSAIGASWKPVVYKEEDGQKVVFELRKVGRKRSRVKLGVLGDDGVVRNGTQSWQYRKPGLFPEAAVWVYKQIAEVWKLDNEFAARWASYAFGQEHRDLKVALAAFMLVQSRCGEPIKEDGKVLFPDEDYRDVGEAMVLIVRKDGKDLSPKLLQRIRYLLELPEIAQLNRELGFGQSARKPFLGRWPKAVKRWLRYREDNPKMLQGLVKAGFRSTVINLACGVGYKPQSESFFEVLRWKQDQAKDGRRSLAIGKAVTKEETWEGLNEEQVCRRIEAEKPGFKRLVSVVPKEVGITRAVMAASVGAGCLSDKDLIIYTPTLEELGLLKVAGIKRRWEQAIQKAEDQRAANIAERVRSKEAREKLQEAADTAVKKAVEEVTKGLRVYVMVDISGSMVDCIPTAKQYIERFLQGFPLDKLHVSVFNTTGREVEIKHPSAVGVRHAFTGFRAGGGTAYGAGIRVLQHRPPKDDEDTLFIFIGDEKARTFTHDVQVSGLRPMAFGLIKVESHFGMAATCVQDTAAELGIPCFRIGNSTFEDPYAIPRTVRALVASTPVGQVQRGAVRVRETLVDQIIKTDLLRKPLAFQ